MAFLLAFHDDFLNFSHDDFVSMLSMQFYLIEIV